MAAPTERLTPEIDPTMRHLLKYARDAAVVYGLLTVNFDEGLTMFCGAPRRFRRRNGAESTVGLWISRGRYSAGVACGTAAGASSPDFALNRLSILSR
jgi:hypothetical protein